MSNQIEKSNRENSRINYLESHIPKRENFSVGRCGQRAYVFVSGKDENS